MIETLMAQLLGSNNQLLSGGLALMLLGSLGYYVRRVPYILWSLFLNYGTVVIDVQSTDRAYDWLLTWLSKRDYGNKTRRVSVKHIRSKKGVMQTVMIPARGQHWFFYKGRPLWVVRSKDADAAAPAGTDLSEALMPKENVSIRVVGRSRKVIDSIIAEAKAEFEAMDKDLTIINRYRWGAWVTARKLKRPLESIMLPPEADNLISDIQKFIDAKDWYRQMGIPYKRGYLFHGPPGTGKSSTIESIGGHLSIPIYLLNLATVSDDSLERAIGDMNNEGPCILLIEDIDTVNIKRDSPDKPKVSLGTLLNVLDGVQAADSVILVMTSNNPETLDGALTRHGRVDRWIEFGMATEDQIKIAIARFLGQPTLEQCQSIGKWPRPISMAEVQEHLKQLALGTV